MRPKNQIDAYIISLLSQYKFYLIALILCAGCHAIYTVSVPAIYKTITETFQKNGNLQMILIAFLVCQLAYHLLEFVKRWLDMKYKPRIFGDMMHSAYIKAMNHSLGWFDDNLSGEISAKVSDLCDSAENLFAEMYRVIYSIYLVIFLTISLFMVSYIVAVVIILFIIVYLITMHSLLSKQIDLQSKYMRAKQEAIGMINDSIANAVSIKIIGSLSNEIRGNLIPSIGKWSRASRNTKKFDAYRVNSIDAILSVAMFSAQIISLGFLLKWKAITSPNLNYCLILSGMMRMTLNDLLDTLLNGVNPQIAKVKSAFSFLNTAPSVTDKKNAIVLENVDGAIRFENVRFAYEKDRYILNGISLSIRPGEKIGIVGSSGAGKTTLIKCLLRYFDIDDGNIFIDNNNIAFVTQESLRKQIGVIPQEPSLLHRSILDNLLLSKPDATLEEVIEVCKITQMHDDVMEMTNGYDTVVADKGAKLSGGQRQRIAIARALLKDPPIIVLDEATSALDSVTESIIQVTLDQFFNQTRATVVCVAHRLSTLQKMDRIIVLDDGQIIENGTHNDLLKQNGLYKKMYDAQTITENA